MSEQEQKEQEQKKETVMSLNMVLSSDYVGKNMLDVITSLNIVYQTFYGEVRLTHTLEYMVKTYGPPTDVSHLITKFPAVSASDRLLAVKAYIESGGDPNDKYSGALLLHALHKGFHEIAAYLFENGAVIYRVYPDSTSLFYGICIKAVGPHAICALTSELTVTPACRLVMLKNVLANYLAYPQTIRDGLIKRLEILTSIQELPEDVIPGFAAMLDHLFTCDPVSTVQCKPVNFQLRRLLLTEYGRVYDTGFQGFIHDMFIECRQKTAKLDAIKALLPIYDTSSEMSVLVTPPETSPEILPVSEPIDQEPETPPETSTVSGFVDPFPEVPIQDSLVSRVIPNEDLYASTLKAATVLRASLGVDF